MEDENLHLLINEEIYLISEDDNQADVLVENTVETALSDDQSNAETVANEEVMDDADSQEQVSESQPEEKSEKESEQIPVQKAVNEEIPFAVFHNSTNESDIELLNKIISACKLPENQYQIFSGGFDQTKVFRKALVFVPEAKAFYTPIPYKNSEFLCSKPLDQISGDVQEKTKLWTALQKFVDTLQ